MKAFIIGTATAIATVVIIAGTYAILSENRQYPIILDVSSERISDVIKIESTTGGVYFTSDPNLPDLVIVSDNTDLLQLDRIEIMVKEMHAVICAPLPKLEITDGKGNDFNEDCFACVDPNFGLHFHYVWTERTDK